MHNTENNVLIWAKAKGITAPGNSHKQALKFIEEAGEVCGAILKNQPENLKLEIGDVLVTLAILANQNGTDLSTCCESAYQKIKDRTGQTVNGVFVKQSDL